MGRYSEWTCGFLFVFVDVWIVSGQFIKSLVIAGVFWPRVDLSSRGKGFVRDEKASWAIKESRDGI